MTAVAEDLGDMAGARHVAVASDSRGATSLVTADVRTDAADAVLALLARLGVPADDVVLARLDTIGAEAGEAQPLALVWADVLAMARVRARAPGRYFVLMATAGVVGAFAVIDKSAVLLVGIALSAGVAGMLAVETRASSAVGVAISVTTVPAVAYLGVAAGTGEWDNYPSGLAVLTTNVAMMLLGGSTALAIQRMIASRHSEG